MTTLKHERPGGIGSTVTVDGKAKICILLPGDEGVLLQLPPTAWLHVAKWPFETQTFRVTDCEAIDVDGATEVPNFMSRLVNGGTIDLSLKAATLSFRYEDHTAAEKVLIISIVPDAKK